MNMFTEHLENRIEELEKNAPKNLQDELKYDVCCRLFKNLTLEQLENLEASAIKSQVHMNRNYIKELP